MADNPVVLVTGASRGVGAWVARWLGKVGACVTVMARSRDKLEETAGDVERLGGTPLVVTADVADPHACRETVRITVDRFGRIDALVNNAGTAEPLAPVASSDPEAWRYNIEVNLLGPFYLARAAIRALRKNRGRIVNVSSGAATITIRAGSAYCAAKAGLNHLTRVLAEEEPSLTSLAVRPGVVDTDMQARIRQEGPGVMTPDQVSYYQSLKAEGRLEDPRVPARSIAWLSLRAPAAWNGQFLDYDDPRVTRPSAVLFGKAID